VSEPDTSAADQRRRTGALVIVLSVLAGLLAASSIALALVAKSERDDRAAFLSAREAAATAAGRLIVNLDALSAPTIDKDMRRVVDGATGTFKKQFTKSQKQLKTYVLQQKITSSGTLRSVGVIRSDTDTATVLVAVDRTFKDSGHPKGVVANDRWKVSLEKHGGRWLVAELEPVA